MSYLHGAKQGLEQQIMEKQASQELERRRDQAFADRLLVTEQRVQMMERDVQRARKDAALSLQVYFDDSLSQTRKWVTLPAGVSRQDAAKTFK
mmetsp:Transcript_6837/g.21394  ORF Transcript_6837/g.21394 Transcript_6837/m.21394 type:complete len:93 (-) Transcript_6837:924-1202(-)